MLSNVIALSALYASSVYAATISTTTRQTINGIGASGAWWTKDLDLMPQDVRSNVARLLFDQNSGLGLTDYRYNLGGGGVGVTTWARATETPYISDGKYNFTKDAGGVFFLREAARYGVPQLTLFVNSAPSTFTDNSKSCGGNLRSDRVSAFATYIVDATKYWQTQGVKITHISPMNEPDSSFSECAQEGMIVPVNLRAQVVSTLATALKNAGLGAKIIADETSTVAGFSTNAPKWLSTSVGSNLASVAHHQYGFADTSTQTSMGKQGRSLSGKPTWFTEICCFAASDSSQNPLATLTYKQGYDPAMASGLQMANLLFQSFEYIEDEHWDWWTALSNGYGCSPKQDGSNCAKNAINTKGWNDGLIYYDPQFIPTKDYSLGITKRYTVLRHYARAAPLGSVRRSVTSVESNWRVLAFDNPGSCTAFSTCNRVPRAIVAFNGQNAASTLVLRASSGFSLQTPSQVFRSSPNEDYVQVSAPQLQNGEIRIDAPALSIYTLFF